MEADYSGSMVRMSHDKHAASPAVGGVRCFGHRIPLRDRAVELSFSMRLNHHLVDPAVRREHLRELFRVSSRWAMFTYFDHGSVKDLLRRVELRAIAKECGFRIVDDPWMFVIGSGHRMELAERIGAGR